MSGCVKVYCHVSHRAAFLHRLLAEKIIPGGLNALIYADEKEAAYLDDFLWTWKANDFLPHAIVEEADTDTPIGIISALSITTKTDTLILWSSPNHTLASGEFPAFGIIVDIIGKDEEEIKAGRFRYQSFQERGYRMETHKIGNG